MFDVPKPTPVTPPPKPASTMPDMRDFGDAKAMRSFIYDDALKAASEFQPINNDKYELRLRDVKYIDPERYTRKDRKKALLTGGTLSRRMGGTWDLIDRATNLPIESRKQVVARIPYLSSMGTFTFRGNDYSVNHQQRLLAGIYAREKKNGDLESYVNVLPGQGVSHRYNFDPKRNVFKMSLGQSEMPLMPLLRAMGTTDQEFIDHWGPDIYHANYGIDDASTLKKLGDRLLPFMDRQDPNETSRQKKLVAAVNAMGLDPDVMQSTHGQPFKNLSKEAILAATKKLLAIRNKETDAQGRPIEVDDRDNMAYQRVLGPEDFIAERIRRDHGRLQKQAFRKIALAGTLGKMPSGLFTPQVEQVLIGSGLGQALEEINPAEVFDRQTRITRLGEGGIPSLEAIPDESRNVQPSHMGYIDPLRTPESMRAGIDLHLARRARKGRDGKVYAPFQDAKTGSEVWLSPQQITSGVMATPDALKWDTKYIPAMRNGKHDYVRKDEVQYVFPHMENAFSALGNLVPIKSAVKGQRVAMASRMLTQALPVRNAESPLVRGAMPENQGRSFEEEYGTRMGAIHAEHGGRVVAVSPDEVKVQYLDGRSDTLELYNHHPFNRKSVTGRTRVWIRRRNGDYWSGPISDYSAQPEDYVWSIDAESQCSAWCRISGFVRHRNDKQLVRVRTDSGRSVEITVDHSLVTLGDDGRLTPIYPRDCVLNRTRLPVAMLPVSGRVVEHVERKLATLAGLYLAEGHLPEQDGLVAIAVEPTDRAEQVLTLLQDLGLNPYRNGGNVCFTDHAVRAWLHERFGTLSGGKFIRPDVMQWNKVARLGLLNGYFAGDGCLWEDSGEAIQVQAVSTSRQLRDDLVVLLSSLGVFSTLFDAPRACINANWNDAYGLRVISSHLHKLPTWFFYADRERYFRELLKTKYRASPFDAVPVVSKLARQTLYAELPVVSPYVYKTAHSGGIAKHRLADATGVFGGWSRSDVMWDKIAAIEPIPYEAEVFDFCVEGSEVFAVDHGLIVHNTYIHQTATVKPGDTFAPGQLLARSNYTDDKGVTALGLNLRTAYIPWKGYNYEDAVVLSESAAKKMTSEHMYQHDVEATDKHKFGRGAFINLFPQKYSKDTLSKLDDRGVIQVGEAIQFGDPMILAARQRDRAQNKIHKQRQPGYVDDSVVWKHHDPGIVTDVVWGDKGPVVLVKSFAQMQVGDKLSGRYGDKGVVAAIVPDGQMPHDQDGKPFEVALNPLGIQSRTNPAQKAELWLGKIAKLTGKPYTVADFENIPDVMEYVRGELRKHNLPAYETVVDPTRHRNVPSVATGHRFFMKLHHTAESKVQGRATGGYTQEDAPAKGGESGCFTADAMVYVQHPMEADKVMGLDIGTIVEKQLPLSIPSRRDGRSVKDQISDWFRYEVSPQEVLEIQLETPGGVIRLCPTKNHVLIMSDGTERFAGELQPGDELME